MRIFYELRYTVIIEIVWIFYLKSIPAKFKNYSNHISWVISGTSSSKLSCNPRHPSRNISCNHCHHLLQPSWRRIFSTSNNQKTRVDSDINSDYKASSFDKLYIRHRKWDTAGFVRAHQWKYWNALTIGRGHADDGCSCGSPQCYGYIAIFQNYCCFTKHEGYYEKLNSTKSLGIYYWYVKIQCTPDISRSCISRNWIYCGHVLDPIFWGPRAWYFSKSWSLLGPNLRETIGNNFLRNQLLCDGQPC